MRWLIKLVVFVVAVAFSLLASVQFHLDTALGRELGRDILNDYVSGEMAGTLQAGTIEQLLFWHCIVKDTYVYDPKGRKIIYAERVDLGLDPIAGLMGKLRFTYGDVTVGWVELIDNGKGEPTFLDAFGPADPTPSEGEPLHAIVDNMDIRGIDVYGELLGLKNLRIDNMHVTGRMEFRQESDFDIESATGEIVSPFPFKAKLAALEGRVLTDLSGTRLRAEASKGDEYLTAYLTYRPPIGGTVDDPYVLDIRLLPQDVQAATVRDVGFEWAEPLKGNVTGEVRFHQPGTVMFVDAELETAGGEAKVEGKFPPEGVSEVKISSPEAAIVRVLEGAPEVTIGGSITFLTSDDENKPTIVQVDTNAFEYEGFALPPLKGRGALLDDSIRIDRLRGPYAGGDVMVNGSVNYVSGYDVRIRGTIPQVADDPNFKLIVPDLYGRAELDTRVHQLKNGNIDVRGWVAFDAFRYGTVKADVLQVDGRVSGDPSKPRIDLDLEGGDVRIAGYPIGHGEVAVEGGPKTYNAEGFFRAKGKRRVEFRTTVELERGNYVVNADRVELAVGDLAWRGTLENVVFDPDKQISADRVRMGNKEQKLEVSGVWQFNGPDSIRADLKNYDLTALTIAFPEDAPEVSGRADLHFEFEGDLDRRPQVLAEGTFTNASLWGVSPVTAAYLLTYSEGNLDLDAQVGMGSRGSFSLSVTGLLEPEMTDPVKNLREGVYDVSLAAGGLDLTLFKRWLPEGAPDFEGFADAQIQLEGPIDAPTFRGNIEVPDLRYEDWTSLDMKTEFQYDYGSLVARVQAADPEGELAEVEGSMLIDVVNLVKNPNVAVSTLETSPWRLSLRVPPRTLDALPRSLSRKLGETEKSMLVSVSATLSGGAFRTRGDLHASIDWRGEIGEGLCATTARPRATIRARVKDDEAKVSIDGLVGRRRVIRVTATAPTPIDDWLRAAVKPERPLTQVHALIEEATTEDIPYLCRYAGGPIYGELKIKDLFSDNPLLNFALQSSELRARRVEPAIRAGSANTIVETPPAIVGVSASYENGIGKLDTKLRWWNGGASDVRATLPFIWDSAHPTPEIADDGALEADAHFDRMPLQAALAWMSGVVSAEGILDGNVSARGNVAEPELVGNVRLTEGRVDLRTVGQTLHDVSGMLIFDEDGVFVKDLQAVDAGGTAKVNGQLVLKGFTPEAASVTLEADGFPVRQEGSVVAAVDGKANVRAKFSEDGMQGDVNVAKLDVEVPATTATPQDLAPHPEVFFVGEEAVAQAPSEYRIDLNIDASNPFRVGSREQGFTANVTADLKATYDAETFVVSGPVELRQGHFEVFGKRFNVRSGSLLFDGEPELNPRVDLVARHAIRGTNDRVDVTAFGRLDDPKVEFTCSVATESEAQCIAFLLTGRTAIERGTQVNQEAAANEAGAFLSGVATGVIASGLKSEFGRFAPTVDIRDSGDIDADETEVAIGFDVAALIPDRFRNVIQGLYVEGQFKARRSGGGQDSTGQSQRPGFLIEALWPRRLVTTGTASPPSNWSIDLTWEP